MAVQHDSNIFQLVLSVKYIVTNNLSELLVNFYRLLTVCTVLLVVCSISKEYIIYYIQTTDTSQRIKDLHALYGLVIIASSIIFTLSNIILGDNLVWLMDGLFLKMNSSPESNPLPELGPSSGGGNGGPGGGGNNIHPLAPQNTGDSSDSDGRGDSSGPDRIAIDDHDSALGSDSDRTEEFNVSNPDSPSRFSSVYYDSYLGWD